MGLVDELRNLRVCIDTAPFIYFIEEYRDILLYAEGLTTFEINHKISEMSSRLRAKYTIKTPDAIQIATGVLYGAAKYLTNDLDLKKIEEIKVLVLDDFL